MVALVGFGAIAAPPLSPLVPAAGLIAAALLLYAAPEATAGLSFAALAAGFMAGAALKAKHGSAARRWIAIASGAGVALIAIALDGYFQLPLALQFAVVALLMMGVHLIQRRQSAGQPA